MKHMNVVALLVAIAFPAIGANLTGKAVFKGTAPKAENIKMDADNVCKKAHTAPVPKGDVVVSSKGELANVFIYVKEGVKKESIPADKPAAITFDQHGCMYTPHVFGVRVGQGIKILNSDPTLHNVHALPKSNAGFNMGMATKGQTIEKSFTKPETMVRIKCDVHGWMTAYVGVLDHPYFGVSDANGGFSIANLPAGEYTLEAWHEKLGTKTAKVTVTDAGASAPVEFTFGG